MRIGDESARELESSLIQQVRAQVGVSRVELARQLELAPSTVGHYVDRLVFRGFLKESGKLMQAAGRPKTQLNLDPSAGQFVGVDFEARQIWVSVVDFAQQQLGRTSARILSTDTADTVILKIQAAITEVTRGLTRILGIGVGTPGAIDPVHGIGVHYRHIRGWRNIPIGKLLSDHFSVPVSIENNMRVMAMAEDLFGQGRGVKNFICLGIRSGIGAGVFIDGQLHSGHQHLAGEIGCWPCEQGSTLEKLASFSALAQTLDAAVRAGESTSLTLSKAQVSTDAIIAALRQGDPLVKDVLWRAGRVVGTVAAQMNLLLNPERIIVTGPLAEFDPEFISAIREALEPLAQPPHSQMPTVTGSTLGEYAGALGGAALAVRHWVPSSESQ